MPELPEVETVARGLQRSVVGRCILAVTLGKTDFIDNPAEVEEHLPGRTIEAVERYGKFMLLRLSPASGTVRGGENGDAAPASLLVHLGMTGMLAPYAAEQPAAKHTHVWMQLDDGKELRYTDPRRFGRIAYVASGSLAEELVGYGADPLEISAAEFAKNLGARQARVKALLLDQSVLRGVGNIYADESLWRAKIHPAQMASRLTEKQLKTLHRVLQEILKRAIVMRGSTIADFVDSAGEPGEYQQHHRVYGREGKRCCRCGTTIRRIVVAGRSSHFCSKCQPSPRKSRQSRANRRRAS
jgi:formamidopyrimidine-DNA glycosylase